MKLTDAQQGLILRELEELADRGEYYGNKAQFYKRLEGLIAMLRTGNLYWLLRGER